MGDFNAMVGEKITQSVRRRYGLGRPTRNKRGERLVNFRSEYNLVISNTFLKQSVRILYIWTSRDNTQCNKGSN